jgi:hypothetical protein
MEAAIRSRRQMIASLTFSALVIALPFRAGSALARNGHGGGGGDGDSGGRGGHGGAGRGGNGQGGRGGSSQGGDGRGTGAKGHSNTRGRQDGANAESPNAPGSTRADRGLSFRHRNGIAEEVDSRGRYVMRDNRGRTIVDRTATKSDRDRLRSFLD